MSGKHNKNKIFSIIILFMLFVSSVFISIQTVDFADAGSVWTVESDSDFNNGTLHETEIVGTGDSALLKMKFDNITGWVDKSPTPSSGGRRYHAMSGVYGTDDVVLFGGSDGSYSFK
jgi:hypothetical protein